MDDNKNNKINQHYVWQNYLKPWTTNKKICCLKDKCTIITTNTRNIASERYFYKLTNLTIDNINLIEDLFIKKNSQITTLLKEWSKPIKLLIFLSETNKSVFKNEAIKDEIIFELNNMLEEVHSNIETAGYSSLKKIQSGNISFLAKENYDNDEAVNFIIYLCTQYFRTKQRKEKMKSVLPKFIDNVKNMNNYSIEHEHMISRVNNLLTNFDDAYNLICMQFATMLGYNILSSIKNNEYHLFLLDNISEIPFITSDQPIINIMSTLDLDMSPEKLEFYYPVSPTKALLIGEKNNYTPTCTKDLAKKYNDSIVKHSRNLIFANNEKTLQSYCL